MKTLKKSFIFILYSSTLFFINLKEIKHFKSFFHWDLKKISSISKLIEKKTYANENPPSLLPPKSPPKPKENTLSIAKKHFIEKNYRQAYVESIALFKSLDSTELKREVWLLAIQSLEKLNLFKEALEHIDLALEDHYSLFEQNPLQLYSLRWTLLLKSSSYLEALYTSSFLIERTEDLNLKNLYYLKSKELIQSYLPIRELKRVIRSRRLKIFHAQAYFKLAYFFMNEKSFRKANHYFKKVLKFEKEDLLRKKALNLIEKIKSQKTVNPYNIGVILPLSGKHSELSRKILHGLQMGFEIFDAVSKKKKRKLSPFKISVMDSFGNSALASSAVEKLFFENKVIAVLGSLLSRTSESTARKANELGIPCISFSQKSNLTQIGPYVFKNALSSQMQIQKLVHFLIKKKKFKNFGILFPNDAYGIELTNVFWDEVRKLDGQITAAQVYKPRETDFKYPIQRLVGLYDLQDREEEYQNLVTYWLKKQRRINSRKSPPDNLLKPILTFDALFVPDDIKTIGQIAPLLAYYEINNVNLIGTNLWNAPSLIKRGQKHIQGAFFVDHIFNPSNSQEGLNFLKKYRRIFKEEPNLFSLRAYETATILKSLIEEGEKTRIGLKNKLTILKNFKSIAYNLDMNERREIKQHLSIFTVSQGQIIPIQDL